MRITLAAAVACLTLGGICTAQSAGAAIRRPTDIPAQSLAPALQTLVKQRDIQLVYRAELVADRKTAGASGELTALEALGQLLNGTGLAYTYLDEKTITLLPATSVATAGVRAESSPAASKAATDLARDQAGTTSGEVKGGQSFWDRFRLAQSDQGQNPRSAAIASASESAADNSNKIDLQEIVVTAQKREERLLDTPQSVSVLSGDTLANLGAVQFSDFANTVPGLNFSTAGAGFTQISMRGVTTGYDVSSTVGIYVDDVPYGSSTTFALGNLFGLDPGLFDLDRVEVLLGPQGTLYGASAMGGLIKYVTSHPDTSRFKGDARVGVSSTGDGGGINYNMAAAANVPVIPDKAAIRFSGYETHDGGFIKNVALGRKDTNRGDTYGGRVDFLLTPLDPLSIRLTAFLQNTSRDGEATADYTATGAMPYGALGQSRPYPGAEPFHEQFRLLSGTVTYDFGAGTFTSISGYQTLSEANTWDVTGILGGLCTAPFETFGCSSMAAISRIDGHKFTEEVRLASKANNFIEWQLGAFYTHETSSQYEYFALRDLAIQPQPNNLFTYYVPATYKEYAGFGDLTWHITRRIDITGGLRYSRDDQEFAQAGGGLLGVSKPGSTASENVRTYLGTARYHFTDLATGYLRYATGYRPGGPNYVTLDPQTGLPNGPSTYEPDKLRNYEAGFKAETADRRWAIDLSAYYIDWNNIQIALNNGGFSSIANASGGAKVQGAEFTLTARPIQALTASANLGYTHAYMAQADARLGAFAGERLPGSPRFSASLIADYPIWPGSWGPTVGGTLRYVSDRTVDFNGDRPVNVQPRLPAYALLDIRGGVEIGSANLQLYIHNVFDKQAQLSIILPQFGDRVAIAQPRTVGLAVSTQF